MDNFRVNLAREAPMLRRPHLRLPVGHDDELLRGGRAARRADIRARSNMIKRLPKSETPEPFQQIRNVHLM